MREHRLGSIHPRDRHAASGEWHEQPAGPTPELEGRRVFPCCELLPEWEVAPAECARILPVVEWRVLVPAAPALCPAPGRRRPGLGCRAPHGVITSVCV